MVTKPQIYTATVMHKRLFPKKNAFSYGVYYLALPLPAASVPGWLASFHARDVGPRDGSDPTPWVRAILRDHGLNEQTAEIVLVTMPRVLGHVFNPVSFYLCLDGAATLRAVLCEVHNTFGEQHSYLCAHPDHAPITEDNWLEAEKLFHVSPFLERSGRYKFCFGLTGESLDVRIDYHDAEGKRQLVTALNGRFSPLTRRALTHAFWRHPLVTLKAIGLIHWQALRLFLRGIGVRSKPPQQAQKISASHGLAGTSAPAAKAGKAGDEGNNTEEGKRIAS
tara:strand:- start:8401 stop:9237 length:837 start_codon:yes stop_codon:yes gene_type:complete